MGRKGSRAQINYECYKCKCAATACTGRGQANKAPAFHSLVNRWMSGELKTAQGAIRRNQPARRAPWPLGERMSTHLTEGASKSRNQRHNTGSPCQRTGKPDKAQNAKGLTRANIHAHEEELLGREVSQAEKDMALSRCLSSQRSFTAKNPKITPMQFLTPDDVRLSTLMRLCTGCASIWGSIFLARSTYPERPGPDDSVLYAAGAPRCDLGLLFWIKLRNCLPPSVSLPVAPVGSRTVCAVVRLHWCQIPLRCLPGHGSGSQGFGTSRRVFSPKTVKVNAQGLLIRSQESLRRLTRCNSDRRILSAAMCSGLRGFSVECIHPSQRCVTQRIRTDNIFEIETGGYRYAHLLLGRPQHFAHRLHLRLPQR